MNKQKQWKTDLQIFPCWSPPIQSVSYTECHPVLAAAPVQAATCQIVYTFTRAAGRSILDTRESDMKIKLSFAAGMPPESNRSPDNTDPFMMFFQCFFGSVALC